MPPKKITVKGVGGVKLTSEEGYHKWLERQGVPSLLDNENCQVDFGALVDGGEYTLGPSTTWTTPILPGDASQPQPGTSRPPRDSSIPMTNEREIRRIFDDEFTSRMARMNLRQTRRDLSLNSKSDAWRLMVHENRVTQGHSFFFSLQELPNGFDTVAFGGQAETANMDENKFHHPYFLEEMRKLVSDALKFGVHIRQKLLWTKDGHWLTLDDSPTNGTEPDFSLIQSDCDSKSPIDRFVGSKESGVTTPPSKYEVSVCFQQKKKFVESDLMEAIDYGQRLLRIQREREYALTALFHCHGNEKIIRWVRVQGGVEGYKAQITRPFSLAPGKEGQHQFLTLLAMSSAQIGLVRPCLLEPVHTGVSCDIGFFAGRGATSRVYSTSRGSRKGALKILEPPFVHLVDREVSTLAKLASTVSCDALPQATKIARNAIFFDEFLFPTTEGCPRPFVEDLLSCLKVAHTNDIVHRDVRPENIMKTSGGKVVLNDWGCSATIGQEIAFAGTFRYASEEVLTSVIQGQDHSPKPKDDLHSLVRTVVALNDVNVRNKLSDIPDGSYGDVIQFWKQWQKQYPIFAGSFFAAAENLDYDTLKQLR